MGLVLASMWTLARLKVQSREPPAWVSAHRKGQQDAMGTRRHLSNNKPRTAEKGGQEGRAQAFPSLPQPPAHTPPPSQTQRYSPLYIKAYHPHSLISLF